MLTRYSRFRADRQFLTVTDWEVTDFKSIDHVQLPLNKVVFLTGANSSGKSSVIQSLLLLAQSTDYELIMNGTLVRLGEGRDVVRSDCAEVSFAFASEYLSDPDEPGENWAFEITFRIVGPDLRVSRFNATVNGEPVLSATSTGVTERLVSELNPDGRFGEAVLRIVELEGVRAPSRTYLTFRGFQPEVMLVKRDVGRTYRRLRRVYGSSALRDADRVIELYDDLSQFRRHCVDREIAPDVIELIDEVLPRRSPRSQVLAELDRRQLDRLFSRIAETVGSEGWAELRASRFAAMRARARHAGLASSGNLGLQFSFVVPEKALNTAAEAVRLLRESTLYLGPLREEPQVVSATGGRSRNVPVGIHGEYTADLLALSKHGQSKYVDPTGAEAEELLSTAVNQWISYLGVGQAVRVVDQGKLGRGLRINVNGVDRDLTTVGVGASQLLPVVALVLWAPRGATVLLEQPELHLHPAVQSRLADFFLFARPDVSLVIETHSEYLITRMRRRVAERKINADKVALIFAEQQEGVSEFNQLRVDSLGDLSAWPAGFFDTQDEENRALVQAISDSIVKDREEAKL
jgi:predicted ATPase